MKTKMLYIAALLVAGAFMSFRTDAVRTEPASEFSMKAAIPEGNNMVVHYQVNVYQSISAPLCGTYMVEIVTSTGQIVGTPQPYQLSKSTYFVTETVHTATGIRIARIVQVAAPDGSFCVNTLYTHSDTKNLVFHDGMAYFFNLYPTYNQNQISR
jgi:hypothetical protein